MCSVGNTYRTNPIYSYNENVNKTYEKVSTIRTLWSCCSWHDPKVKISSIWHITPSTPAKTADALLCKISGLEERPKGSLWNACIPAKRSQKCGQQFGARCYGICQKPESSLVKILAPSSCANESSTVDIGCTFLWTDSLSCVKSTHIHTRSAFPPLETITIRANHSTRYADWKNHFILLPYLPYPKCRCYVTQADEKAGNSERKSGLPNFSTSPQANDTKTNCKHAALLSSGHNWPSTT